MRLIDLESPEVDAILDKYKHKDGGREYNRGVSDLLFQIMHAPTVDPVEHGRWIDLRVLPDSPIECSYCGKLYYNCEPDEYNYCPHCGAKMGTN